jgi:hypothetical protein
VQLVPLAPLVSKLMEVAMMHVGRCSYGGSTSQHKTCPSAERAAGRLNFLHGFVLAWFNLEQGQGD